MTPTEFLENLANKTKKISEDMYAEQNISGVFGQIDKKSGNVQISNPDWKMLCNDFDTFFRTNEGFEDFKNEFETLRNVANKRHIVNTKIIGDVDVLIHKMQNEVLVRNAQHQHQSNQSTTTSSNAPAFIEQIVDDKNSKETLAIIIRADYDTNGITFVTPNDYSQQLAYMHHPKNHVILPHIHNEVKREIYYTKEVLIIKDGKLRCDFYSCDKEYIKSVILRTGDIILLVSGGHGFECLEETKMIEIKQGPYAGENDKTRFEPYKI